MTPQERSSRTSSAWAPGQRAAQAQQMKDELKKMAVQATCEKLLTDGSGVVNLLTQRYQQQRLLRLIKGRGHSKFGASGGWRYRSNGVFGSQNVCAVPPKLQTALNQEWAMSVAMYLKIRGRVKSPTPRSLRFPPSAWPYSAFPV